MVLSFKGIPGNRKTSVLHICAVVKGNLPCEANKPATDDADLGSEPKSLHHEERKNRKNDTTGFFTGHVADVP